MNSGFNAEKQLERAIQNASRLEADGDLNGAWDRYQAILRVCPGHTVVLARLGIIAGRKSDYSTAIVFLSEAVKREPKNASLRSYLGLAYLSVQDFDNALVQLKKADSLSPGSTENLKGLAHSYLALGKSDKALKIIGKLLQSDPDHSGGLLLKARAYLALGKMDDAACIYRLLADRGIEIGAAYDGLARARKYVQEPAELAEIEACLDRDSLESKDRYQLHLAAGKIADDCGQYDRAFKHFVSGKKNFASKFDLIAYGELVNGLKEIVTPSFIEERRNFASRSDRPVFIFGMPRSGSTLTEQIIAAHPQAKPGGEIPYFQRMMHGFGFDRSRPDFFLRNLRDISPKDAARLADGYLADLRRQSRGARRVTDKMPHNFEHLWLISLLFPLATYIHSVRDPVDNCLSCFASPLNEYHNYTVDLVTLGRFYRLQFKLIRHWYETLPVDILPSRYEALVRNLEDGARKLVVHAGLDWNDACLDFDNKGGSVHTLSSWQVRQPLYETSVARWKNYDRDLGPLKEALGDLCESR